MSDRIAPASPVQDGPADRWERPVEIPARGDTLPADLGLPLQGVAVILGVDVLMDMARTSVNLVGNCLAAVAMARWDGSFALSPDDVG